MKKFNDLGQAIKGIGVCLSNTGHYVKKAKWQGIKDDKEFLEALQVSFQAPVPSNWNGDILKDLVRPNLPWAEDHFQERISGIPSNPGEQYKNWPFFKRQKENDRHRDGNGLHSHTYMERIWPRFAGRTSSQGLTEPTDIDNWGIRYRLGDLDDLINHIAFDPSTNQAYLPIWFPEDTGVVHEGRVPCSLGYHFIIRHGFMHITYYMRSVDYLRHFRDDVYMAARLLQFVCNAVNKKLDLSFKDKYAFIPGTLTMHMVSLHIFYQEKAYLEKLLTDEQ